MDRPTYAGGHDGALGDRAGHRRRAGRRPAGRTPPPGRRQRHLRHRARRADPGLRRDRLVRAAETSGGLQLPDSDSFVGLAQLLGEDNELRVWWRAADDWRIDRVRSTGETDLFRQGQTMVRWVFESETATITPVSRIRLPDASDLLPPTLARQMLQGVRPDELTRLPVRRIAGLEAPGLRLIPAEPASTVARVDIWADPVVGLPVQVELYAAGDRPPVVSTTLASSAWRRRPLSSQLSVPPPASRSTTRSRSTWPRPPTPSRRTTCRPPLAGLTTRDGEDPDAVGVYGRGPTTVMVLPLRGQVARPLRARLRESAGSSETEVGTLAPVGPVGLLLTPRISHQELAAAHRHGQRRVPAAGRRRAALRVMTGTPVIRTRALTKRFGELRAVDAIDIEVPRATSTASSAPTARARPPRSGCCSVWCWPPRARRRCSASRCPPAGEPCFPRSAPWSRVPAPTRTCPAPPTWRCSTPPGPTRFPAAQRRGRIAEVLAQVGLDPADRRPTRTYSLGMKQRLGLAAALLRRPRLLVLDEPTNGLDPQGITEIRQLLLDLNAAGTTIFLSSHLLAEVEQMCTRVGVLDRGRLVLQEQLDVLLRPTGLVERPDPRRLPVRLAARRAGDHGRGRPVVDQGRRPGRAERLPGGQGVRVAEVGPYRRNLERVVLEAGARQS